MLLKIYYTARFIAIIKSQSLEKINIRGGIMIKKIIINISVLVFLISNTSFADIKFWTTEVQPARMAKQEEMAKAFEAKHWNQS